MENMEKANKIEVKDMSEHALAGISHLLTQENWYDLLSSRVSDIRTPKALSAQFILDNKDNINFANFVTFFAGMLSLPEVRDQYTLDLMRRFWKFATLDAGGAPQLVWFMAQNDNTTALIKSRILDHQSKQETLILVAEDNPTAKLPTFQDYEKNPYNYDMLQLMSMVMLHNSVPVEFAERFVHLFPFGDYFTNSEIPMPEKENFVEKFGVQIGNSKRWLFPDGSVVEGENLDSISAGREYLDNVQRYATEDEKAIREIIARFPRAVKDCFDPENAEAMKAK